MATARVMPVWHQWLFSASRNRAGLGGHFQQKLTIN
jgi:hypothetical protein